MGQPSRAVRLRRLSDGQRGWAALIFFVAFVDGWLMGTRRQTMTTAFQQGLNGKRRWAWIAFWGYLTAHLFDWWPRRIDPLHLPGHISRR